MTLDFRHQVGQKEIFKKMSIHDYCYIKSFLNKQVIAVYEILYAW